METTLKFKALFLALLLVSQVASAVVLVPRPQKPFVTSPKAIPLKSYVIKARSGSHKSVAHKTLSYNDMNQKYAHHAQKGNPSTARTHK